MTATMTLLNLAGAMSLLLWGLHMVQSGVQRAYGADLRRFLEQRLRNRVSALAAGMGVTILLQSSTATGFMITAFLGGGFVGLVPALAVMLGANIGTALVVQLLSFDISAVSPILIVIGVAIFRRSTQSRTRDLSRVAIGLGLMLMSLHLLVGAMEPVETAPIMRALFTSLTADLTLTMLVTAALTWAAHSSIATVLLTVSLAGAGVVSPPAALAMVLGANLGSAVNPLIEGAAASDRQARRLPLGNMINRLIGAVMLLPIATPLAELVGRVEADPGRQVALFHLAFNVVLAAAFLLPLPALARLVSRLLPDRSDALDPTAAHYLDSSALTTPHLALAAAAREAMRMADAAETMLRGALDVLSTDDRRRLSEIRRMDDVLDRLNGSIKRYLAQLPSDGMDEADSRRQAEILNFTTNIEHAGDIIVRNLMDSAAKKIKRRLSFAQDSEAETLGMLHRLIANAQLASSVFMTGDARSARRLMAEKAVFRDMETNATERHFTRLCEGQAETVDPSALHIDLLRDMKRINAHFAAAAYPVLEERGELLQTRLKHPA